MITPRHVMSIAALAAALSACATFGEPPLKAGQSEAEVGAVLGRQTGRHALPGGGTRLEYARGPYGRQTWMADLGADGRLQRWDQVLNTRHFADFAQRAPGMSLDELRRTLGTPGERQHGGLRGGEVWSYRYPTNDCLWFQVDIGADGRVIGGGYATDPACDVKDPPSSR